MYNLILTGGGTAGHVWPHFALVDDTSTPLGKAYADGEVKIFYFGSESGMERDLVQSRAPKWKYIPIKTGKLRRYFSWQNFIDPFKIVYGFFQAFITIGRIKPSAIFSKGGFVSAPAVWAAWFWGVPVFIHESDATPALATKLTLPFAFKALYAFEETVSHTPGMFKDRVVVTGLPLRKSLFTASKTEALSQFGLAPDRKTILIMGGSLGAEGLNKKIAPALSELGEIYNILHIVGKGKSFHVDAGPFYKQYEFLNEDMPLAYAVTDLAICRAGASSIFELAAARIPMILVPLGLHQSRGDQIINAKIFEKKGWARVLEETTMTKEDILEEVRSMFYNHKKNSEALSLAPSVESAARVGSLILETMKSHNSSHASE